MKEVAGSVQASWRRFLDVYEPLRPELYRYCRCLTRSAWDAEDLVQDTMARAFVTLASLFQEVSNPKAWLFRVASNLWIDRSRRAGRPDLAFVPEANGSPEPRATREAVGTLITRLSPQERAALVLKDVFELTLAEIALAISTSEGAVKDALHRARGKLGEPDEATPAPSASPAPRVLDAFCEAFNARDLDRLTALLLENALVEVVGLVTEYGPEAPRNPVTGTFHHTLAALRWDPDRGGVDPAFLSGDSGRPPWATLRMYRDEVVLLAWYAHEDGNVVRNVLRFETEGDLVVRVRCYFFAPEVIAEVCSELGVPFRVNGYRFWESSSAA